MVAALGVWMQNTGAGWVKVQVSAKPPSGALGGSLALAKVSRTETIAAVAVEARGRPETSPPPNVLFLVDRSRSVGLPGLAAERDLARKLLEALPPATRFDALFFTLPVGYWYLAAVFSLRWGVEQWL